MPVVTSVLLFIVSILFFVGFGWLAKTLREIAQTMKYNSTTTAHVVESLDKFTRTLENWTTAVNHEFPMLSDTVRGVAPRMNTFELRLTELERRLTQVEGDTGKLLQRRPDTAYSQRSPSNKGDS